MNKVEFIDLVIFDCDGVLVDSEPLANALLAEALRRAGLDISYEDTVGAFVGLTMPDVVATAERMLGRALPEDFVDELQKATFDTFRRDLKPMPDAAEVVRAVQDLGIATCVASNGSLDKMAVSLGVTGLDGLFDGHVFSRSQVERGKPAPDLFLHAAHEMDVPPARCLVIEDSPTGIAAARAAGMRVFRFAPEGAEEGDVPVVARLAEIPGLLAS